MDIGEAIALVVAKLDEIQDEVKSLGDRLASGPALLLNMDGACRLLSVSRTHFYRLRSLGLLPSPIGFGTGEVEDPRWRRSDLEACVARMKTRRPKSSTRRPASP